MRSLHIVMPMAGEGSRFRDAGWTTPKPLIDLKGKPLFVRAIESVRIDGAPMKYSFIVRKEHIDLYGIDRKIKAILPDARVYSVEKTTRGAVETCLIAENGIDDDDAVVVMDCDLEFDSREYRRLIEEALNTPSDCARGGALVSFTSDLPKYSYAEVGDDGLVTRTAEKEVISSHALCGAYFFSSGREFKSIAHRLLDEPVMIKPEFYVSLLYNYMLADGAPVKIAPMEVYRSYGTPEELALWQ
ncbi:MAG: glycosyltransferase family 2 protein [Muribaculaceae bacterium]|nr:glycosyltransferase family 2 protein [Muribaculaceae bacterium]